VACCLESSAVAPLLGPEGSPGQNVHLSGNSKAGLPPGWTPPWIYTFTRTNFCVISSLYIKIHTRCPAEAKVVRVWVRAVQSDTARYCETTSRASRYVSSSIPRTTTRALSHKLHSDMLANVYRCRSQPSDDWLAEAVLSVSPARSTRRPEVSSRSSWRTSCVTQSPTLSMLDARPSRPSTSCTRSSDRAELCTASVVNNLSQLVSAAA
jgi:hypothetical protein